MDNQEKGLGKRLSSDIDKRLHDLIYNRNNPVGVLQTVAGQLFERLNYQQLRWTAVSRAKLYKALREAFAAEKDLNLLDLEYEVKQETLRTKSAKQKWKRRRYEGTETEADQEWKAEADDWAQTESAKTFSSYDAVDDEVKRRRSKVFKAIKGSVISEEKAQEELDKIDRWKKKMYDDLESRL